jgi:hypothetical protein
MGGAGRGPWRRQGFYRGFLGASRDGEAGRADPAESLRRRLAEEIRKRPGELHLLLQGSKVLLRTGRRSTRETRAELEQAVMRVVDGLGGQLLGGESGANLP